MDRARNYQQVLAEQRAALDEYAELARNADSSQSALAEASTKVRNLSRELSAAISAGADVCKQCTQPPMGMVKTPSYFNGGVEVPAVYEVGCVYCDPVLVDSPERGVIVNLDGNERRVLRRSFSARGGSPEEAVKRWNQGDFVEDQFIERMPGLVARRAG